MITLPELGVLQEVLPKIAYCISSNLISDEILVVRISEELPLISFPAYLAYVELYLSETFRKIIVTNSQTWGIERKKRSLIANHKKNNASSIRVGNHEVVSKSLIRYLR